MGLVETSDYENRKFTLRSIEFNLKSTVFNELFPDLKRETEDEIKRRKELMANPRAHISHGYQTKK